MSDASGRTGKIKKEVVLYAFNPETEYTCGQCVNRVPGTKTCALFGPNNEISPEHGSCGFYVHEDAERSGISNPVLGNITKLQAGYAENEKGFSCKRCEYFLMGKNDCRQVDRNSDGLTPGEIHPNACCNNWEPDEERSRMDTENLLSMQEARRPIQRNEGAHPRMKITMDDLRQRLNATLWKDARFSESAESGMDHRWYVYDILVPNEDGGWVAVISDCKEQKRYKLPFTLDDEENVTISDTEPVETQQAYVDVTAAMAEAFEREQSPVEFFQSEVRLTSDGKVPEWIMYFPEGTGTYYPEYDGDPIEISATCTKDALKNILACAAYRGRDKGGEPWADFNHKQEERSFDPIDWKYVTGTDAGIYVKPRWSGAGLTAVTQRNITKFSPCPLFDAEYDKLEEDDRGCLVFPPGARGSKENPAQIVGFAKIIGGMTNKPAIKNILPIAAEEAARRTAAPNKPNQGVTVKKSVYFIKKPARGGYAEGATVEMEADAADAYIKDNEAIDAASAPAFQQMMEQRTRDAERVAQFEEQQKALDRQAVEMEIQAALTRNAIGAKEMIDDPDNAGKKMLFTDYLRREGEKQPQFTIRQVKMMKGRADLTTRTVERENRDEQATGADDPRFDTIKFGECSFKEGVRAWQFKQMEARRAMEKGVDRKRLDVIRAEAFERFERLVNPAFENGGNPLIRPEWGHEFTEELGPRFANSFATLASTNIVSNRSLILLRKLLRPFTGQFFDFSTEGVKLNQAFITRTIGVSVVQHKTTSGAYVDSDAATYDVSVTPTQISYVQNTIDVVSTAASTRKLFGEQKEQKFYGLAKDCFETWTGIMTVANFDKTATLGRVGYSVGGTASRLTLIGIDADLDALLNPEEGRIAMFATGEHAQLRTDPALVSYWQAGPESEARRTGVLGERENITPWKTQSLNSRTDIVGFAQTPGATACAGRLPDLAEKAAGVPFAGMRNVVVEPETGLAFLETLFCQPDGSSASHRVELIFAAGVGQANQGEVIVP